MSQIQVDNIYNKEATGSPSFPLGANVTGVVTATTFKGGAEITSGTINATSVTAASGTFNGPVTIGGTLTYEDVTNIDSVGVITARQGIKVTSGDVQVGSAVTVDTSGINVTGIVTATSYRGDGSQLSGIEAAPTIQATVSGAIAANKAVIVNSDGTVSVPTANPPAFGAEGTAASSVSSDGQVTAHYNPVTKVLVMGFIRSAFPYAKAGTVDSAGTITWGSEVHLGSGGWDVRQLADIVYDSTTEKYILCYSQSNDSGGIRSVWFKAAGTTISDYNNANQQTIEGDNGTWIRACTGGSGKIVVAYNRSDNSIVMKTGTIGSGTGAAITWPGSYTLVENNNANMDPGLTYDPDTGKVIVVYNDFNSKEIKYRVQSITSGGSGITNGNDRLFLAYTTQWSHQAEIQYVPRGSGSGAGRFIVIGYTDVGTAGLYYKVASLSGDTLTFSSSTLISSQVSHTNPVNKLDYNANRKTSCIVYKNTTSNDLKFKEITVTDGTTNSSIGSAAQVVNDSITDFNITYDSDTRQDVVFYTTAANASKYKVRGDETSTATPENFIGFTGASSYTNGQTATIKVVGNVSTQSGLTPGQQYYVLNDGTIGLTPPPNNNIEAGKALTATSLLIKG